MHAKAVLFVDDRKAEVAEDDLVLEERVGADRDIEAAVGEPGQRLAALGAALATGQEHDLKSRPAGERGNALEVLAGEDLGWRHQRGLAPGLDDACHRQEPDHGFP